MTTVAVALALVAALLFGLALVVTQFGLRQLPPTQGALISVPSAAVLLWLMAPLVLDIRGFALTPALIFALVGLLFPATVTLLTFESNRRLGPSVTGALGNVAPLFAILIAVVLFGEIPGLLQIAGIAAILLGIALLSRERRGGGDFRSSWAIALPLAAAAIRGLVQPIAKLGLAAWPSPFAAALIGYTVSAAVIAGVARKRGLPPPAFANSGTLWFVVVGVCNGGAVLALYAALARGPVTLVSPLVATYPLVTLMISGLLLRGSALALPLLVGVALTVAGAALLIAAG